MKHTAPRLGKVIAAEESPVNRLLLGILSSVSWVKILTMRFLCLVPQKVRIRMTTRAWGRYVNLPTLKIKKVASFPAIAYKIKWTVPPPPHRLLCTEMVSERSVLESQDRRSAPRAIIVREQVQTTCHQGLRLFSYQTRRQGCLISASGACGFGSFWVHSHWTAEAHLWNCYQLTFLFLNMNMDQMIHFQPAAKEIHSEMTATIHGVSPVV